MSFFRYSVFALLIFLLPSSAKAIDLIIWEPGPRYPALVLPAIPGSTAEESVKHYLNELNQHPDRASFGMEKDLDPPLGTSKIVNQLAETDQPSFAVFTDRVSQLSLPRSGSEAEVEMKMITRQLNSRNAKVYVLPMVADTGLSNALAEEFRQKIANSFDAILSLGSRSYVHPSLYGKNSDHIPSNLLNLNNDLWRIDTIQKFSASQRGVYYGYCAGHQICAVSQGGELIENVMTDTKVGVTHMGRWHTIEVAPESFLYEMVGHKKRVRVNSYHYQATKENPKLPVNIVARSTEASETLVEAIEFKNGLGITFQFHPEYMNNETGNKILDGIVEHAKNYKVLRKSGHLASQCVRGLLKKMFSSQNHD